MRLDEHMNAREAPTTQSYLTREKGALEREGLSRLPLDAPLEQFISQARSPEQQIEAGELGKHASRGDAARQRLGEESRPVYDEGLPGNQGRRMTMGLPPGVDPEAPSAIKGMNRIEAQRMEEEPIRIPQFGDWQLDAYLKLASQLAGKRALSQAEQTEKAGGIPTPLADQSKFSPGNIAGSLNAASQWAAPINIAKQWSSRIMGHAYAATGSGTALGYSPQSGAGGAYIAGIRNPLAAFTSEAGRQGLGQKVTSIGAMLGGGISYHQAQGLREALGGEGFSNQESGFLGLTTGGEQENLALALEEPVKEGLSPNVAAGFANTTRFGNANIQDLTKSLKGLDTTAKTLKLTVDQTGESMQTFAKESEAMGATQIHGLQAYKEIADTTGIAPSKIQDVGNSPLGTAIMVRHGMFPGTLGGQSGEAQVQVAKETVNLAKRYVTGHATFTTNQFGEREQSTSAAEDQQNKIAAIFHLNPEMVKKISEHGDQIESAARAQKQVKHAQERWGNVGPVNVENYARSHPWATHEMKWYEDDIRAKKSQVGEWAAEEKAGGSPPQNKWFDVNKEIRDQEARLKQYTDRYTKQNKLTPGDKRDAGTAWGHLWAGASAAGVSGEEFNDARISSKGDWNKAFQKLHEDIAAKQKITSDEAEGKQVIELSPDAKRFFEIKDPQAFKTSANAGGPSQASAAAAAHQPRIPATTAQAIKKVQQTEANYGAAGAR